MQGLAFLGFVLRGKDTDEFVAMVAHVLFVCPLPEMHDEIVVTESERFGHAQQVNVLVHKPHLSLLIASLDDTRLRQNNIL